MRRILGAVLAVFMATITLLAVPAAAENAPELDPKPDKADAIATFDFPEIDHPVALRCTGRFADRGPVVGCAWRAREGVEVAQWQLWRLQIRPERGGRELVAELGSDVTAYDDHDVSSPAVYLYVVLGLDRDGGIVARSRPDVARLVERPHVAIHLACHLRRSVTDQPVVTAVSDAVEPGFEPSIVCRWEAKDRAGIRGYVVHRSVDGGERSTIAEVGADTTSIVDHEVRFGHRYSYVVTALNHEGQVVGRSRVVTIGVPVRPHDRIMDRVHDRITDRVHDRVTDHVADRVTDRVADGVADRVTDRVSDPVTDRVTDRVTDHVSDPVSDPVTDRVSDHEIDGAVDSAGIGDSAPDAAERTGTDH